MFPSWSWLGWIDHAAYPWAIEREYCMSTKNSLLAWRNANQSHPHPYAANIFFNSDTAIDAEQIGPIQMEMRRSHGHAVSMEISFPSSFSLDGNVAVQCEDVPIRARIFNPSRTGLEKRYGIFLEDGPTLLDLSTNASQFGVTGPPINHRSRKCNVCLLVRHLFLFFKKICLGFFHDGAIHSPVLPKSID
jgi:hypothetical protein